MSCFAEIYDRINLKNDQQDRTFLSGIGGAYGKMGFVHEKPGTHRQGADTGRGHTGRFLSSGGPCLAEKQAGAVSDLETVGGQANLPTFLGMYRRLGASGRDKPSWSGPGGKRGSSVDLEPETGRLVFSKVRDTAMPNLLDVWLFEKGKMVAFSRTLTERKTKEVEEIHWMWPDEIRRLYDGGRMVPSLGYFFSEIEGMPGEVRSR